MRPWSEYQSKMPYVLPGQVVAERMREQMPAIDAERLTTAERLARIAAVQEAAKQEAAETNRAYHADTNRISEIFWQDARAELGYDDLLKPDGVLALEGYAWERGHAYGYSEVFSELGELVDLVAKLRGQFK